MRFTVCELNYMGNRTVEHHIEEVVIVKSTEYIKPAEIKTFKFIGYDYPHSEKDGSLLVFLTDGTAEIYPASNWQIEFI